MEPIKLMENRMASIFYYSKYNATLLNMVGDVSLFPMENYISTFQRFLGFIIENDSNNMIVDFTRSKNGNMEQREWLVSSWFPSLKDKITKDNFKIIGINNDQVGYKRFVADFLSASLKRETQFKIIEVQNLEDALIASQNNSISD